MDVDSVAATIAPTQDLFAAYSVEHSYIGFYRLPLERREMKDAFADKLTTPFVVALKQQQPTRSRRSTAQFRKPAQPTHQLGDFI